MIHMRTEKPAPVGKLDTGYYQNAECFDNSPKLSENQADHARPIGEIIAVMMARIVRPLENEAQP